MQKSLGIYRYLYHLLRKHTSLRPKGCVPDIVNNLDKCDVIIAKEDWYSLSTL